MTGGPAVRTILFTDLVDSTGRLDRLGDDAAHAESRAHLEVLGRTVAAHHGRLVKSLGDGVMAAFGSAVDAVACAVAMQRALREHNPVLRLRVGLDAGEPIVEADDLFGSPVVAARRLCDLAGPGQVLVSGLVRSLVGRRVPETLRPLGRQQLRGLTEPLETWLVEWAEPAAVPSDEAVGAPGPIRVLIADDQRLVRAGFKVILECEPDLVVVGEAEDGLAAVELVRRLAPDVVLMDIRMPRMNGLDAARQVLAETATRVVVLTTFDADDYVYEALRLGSSGFLLKDAPPDQLVTAVRCAAAGDALIDPAVTRGLIARFATPAPVPAADAGPALPELTAREGDVLRLLARGRSNTEIAAELVVEESTVKTHVARILSKLGVRDRVQAVVRAYESGFVAPG